MKFASRVYTIAGIIGLIEIVPLYFLKGYMETQFPPAYTHVEMYYGFVGVTLAWQFLFLMLARDPVRYRPLMLPTFLEKFGYVLLAIILVSQQRMAAGMLAPVVIDAILGVLFVVSYFRTAPEAAAWNARAGQSLAS